MMLAMPMEAQENPSAEIRAALVYLRQEAVKAGLFELARAIAMAAQLAARQMAEPGSEHPPGQPR